MEAGGVNGGLLEWRPGKGWADVPGSEASGANGVELSKDGKWVFASAWGFRSLLRVSRGAGPPVREAVDLGFRPDNLHWAPDGSLLAAGLGRGETWAVRIDPNSLKVRRLLVLPDSPTFIRGSVAIQVGDEIWVGASRSDRVVIVPVRP